MQIRTIFPVGILFLGFTLHAQPFKVEGFVYDTVNCAAVPRLTVILTPPTGSKFGEKVATTDVDGVFHIAAQSQGDHLLQVKLGAQLVYRDVLQVRKVTFALVPLTPQGSKSGQLGTSFNVSLKQGSRGSLVTVLQVRLRELGFYEGPQDGNFSPALKTALRAFQKSHGIKADGELQGTKSWQSVVCGSR